MTDAPPTQPIYRCELCRFWLGDADRKRGMCRRYPPVIFLASNDERGLFTQTEFPLLFANGWCGEYKAKGPKR